MRYFINISFDGSNFHGWQIQPDKVTIQGKIEKALKTVFQQEISIVGCGRTDAGVHASTYYFHFDTDKKPKQDFVYKLNSLLPNAISVLKYYQVKDDAHARFDATNRSYIYHIHFDKNPFKHQFSYQSKYKNLDFEKMQQVAHSLKKYSDFAALSKFNKDVNSSICKIYYSKLTYNKQENSMALTISANRFLHNMIRRIMGLLINVGRGKISIKEVDTVLSNSGVFKLNFVAPPQGLFLNGVEYPFIDEEKR